MTTTQVIGRNGYAYDATPLGGNLFIVGKFIVVVEDGKCGETICRATKAAVQLVKCQQESRNNLFAR